MGAGEPLGVVKYMYWRKGGRRNHVILVSKVKEKYVFETIDLFKTILTRMNKWRWPKSVFAAIFSLHFQRLPLGTEALPIR